MNEAYSYDAFGNIQETGAYSFMQAYTSSNQISGWNYDQAGNLLTDGLSNSYQYDAEGKTKSGAGASYVYTAAGQRVEKAGSSTVDTVYFGGRPIARLVAGTGWTDLVYGPGGLLLEVPGTQTGSPTYRMADHLGSLVGTLSSAGAVVGTQDLAPFGEVFAGQVNDPFAFTGKERDTESGNDYFGARYYASTMGRYLSPDWSKNPQGVPYADFTNPQTLNLYSYVKNNPLSAFDDDGHATIEVKYNPLAAGSNHSFIVITDRDGTQTVFRAGPSIGAGGKWITPATGGSASQTGTPTSSQSDSSNSSSPGAGQTAQGNPYGQLFAQQESPTDPNGDNMSTISGSVLVMKDDLPASGYIQALQQFDTGLNQANIPYNPLSTNSNAYVTNALQSIGVAPPIEHPWAPGAGTNLNVTPAPPPPPPPPPPPCSVAGACSQP